MYYTVYIKVAIFHELNYIFSFFEDILYRKKGGRGIFAKAIKV
jgi:hypothetical protein